MLPNPAVVMHPPMDKGVCPGPDVVPVARLEAFKALKLSRLESFSALKLSEFETVRVLHFFRFNKYKVLK